MNTELDLRLVFSLIKRNLLIIIASAVVLGAATYAVSAYYITPKYSATAKLYVYNEKSRTEEITTSDLATSQKLVQTYIVILTSNTVLEKVSDELGGEFSAQEIREMLTASDINSTEAFSVTITDTDPAAAMQIANTIADVAPSEIIRVVKAGSVEVIDYATLPESPSSPNVFKNTAIGALIGIILSTLVVILRVMFDTLVRTEEDLSLAYNIPILGIIPTISNTSDTKTGSAGGSPYENER